MRQRIMKSAYKSQVGLFSFNLTMRHGGFTLVELMVAIALSTFLIGGLVLTFMSGRTAAQEAETLSRLQENIRFASDFLIRDIRNAGFRDQLILTFPQFRTIGQAFAQYGDGGSDRNELIVRYAGRGACGRAFQQGGIQQLVENRYFVDLAGDLRCVGTETPAGGTPQTSNVVLASGLDSIEFDFIFPTGVTPVGICDFDDNAAVDTACIGVEITMVFRGNPQRHVQLQAAFRNVIIDQIYGRGL